MKTTLYGPEFIQPHTSILRIHFAIVRAQMWHITPYTRKATIIGLN